ncbi:MAG: hypothetical protein ACR2M3_09545 [Thermomicrobiales bacterium]
MTAPLIALLDNDPAVLSLLHTLLTDEGYHTLRCRPADVVCTHALVARYRPALIISDRWWRRRTDGWAFLTQIWADPATMHIGVVLVCPQAIARSLQTEILRVMRCQLVGSPLDRDDVMHAIAAVVAPTPVQRDRVPRQHALPAADPALPDRLDAPLVAADEDGWRSFLPPHMLKNAEIYPALRWEEARRR